MRIAQQVWSATAGWMPETASGLPDAQLVTGVRGHHVGAGSERHERAAQGVSQGIAVRVLDRRRNLRHQRQR